VSSGSGSGEARPGQRRVSLAIPQKRAKRPQRDPKTDGLCGVSFCQAAASERVRCSEMRFPLPVKTDHQKLMARDGVVEMCSPHAAQIRGEEPISTGRRD
jgi:hypothetical protein